MFVSMAVASFVAAFGFCCDMGFSSFQRTRSPPSGSIAALLVGPDDLLTLVNERLIS
jgi:hypothetical protein